jgi:hypothetical protein
VESLLRESQYFWRKFWQKPQIRTFAKYPRERKISATDWVARMVQYKDGMFASDKMWCFFTLNYSTRRGNQTSGHLFVDGFDNDAPESMDELKDRLRKGDMSFIDKITYYSQRVRGSSSYWRSRWAELYFMDQSSCQRREWDAPILYYPVMC